ncbi:MAG TPA: V-type ATP synthase subunit A [Spirochaetia bacterium]|nr:V-type ATP synthase subunit A [Spirochaetia bacterium]
MIEGRITRINGPILEAEGLGGCGLYDVVEAGEKGLVGEIIRMKGDIATVQIYEDNTGMRIGEAIKSVERPLSVYLGPGLIGQIYDGIQRPLRGIFQAAGSYVPAGVKLPPLDIEKKWHFLPAAKAGDSCGPGTLLGTIQETESILYRLVAPPTVATDAKIHQIVPEGEYTIVESLVVTSAGDGIPAAQYWPVRTPRPYRQKLPVTEPLITGQRVIDILFPISKGGTAAIPGGFGTGKTMTQHAIAKWCDADVIVYIGCGERGNEMTDVLREFPAIVDPKTGRSLMERTILIANTSNMPVAAREVSIYTGVTLAEFYRDMGYHVAIMADSTSRWAEALRELSGRLEEMPAEEGFPAYLPTRLAEFYERGGRVETQLGSLGSITIIGAVSPPGGDFSEPVTQHTKRFIRCFWALDRDLANARHYPAISWLESYSEYAEEVQDWWEQREITWMTIRQEAMEILQKEDRLQQIVKLIGPDALPDNQRIVLQVADMIKNGFLQQNAFDDIDMYSIPEKQVEILRLIVDYYHRADKAIKMGATIPTIRDLSSTAALVRLKSTVPNDNLAAIKEAGRTMNQEFGELERRYAK